LTNDFVAATAVVTAAAVVTTLATEEMVSAIVADSVAMPAIEVMEWVESAALTTVVTEEVESVVVDLSLLLLRFFFFVAGFIASVDAVVVADIVVVVFASVTSVVASVFRAGLPKEKKFQEKDNYPKNYVRLFGVLCRFVGQHELTRVQQKGIDIATTEMHVDKFVHQPFSINHKKFFACETDLDCQKSNE
jgi:hypothetical protein